MKLDLTQIKKDLEVNSPAFRAYYRDKSRYQVLWGGAGCVHPETKIHTEFGLMRICDVDRPMRVLSWSERDQTFQLSLSGGSFPKGKANLYRVTTERGVFESSGHHLVLLSSGEYQRVDSLRCGDELNQARESHLSTIEDTCLSMSRGGGQRYSEIDADCLGRYATLCRQYDPLPHEAGDYAPFSQPSQGDAQGCDRSCLPCPSYAQGKSLSSSRPCLCGDLSCKTHCDEEALCLECDEANHISASFSVCTCNSHLEFQQFQKTSEHHHKEVQCEDSEIERLDSLGDSYLDPKVDKCGILSSSSAVTSIDVVDESEYWCMQVLNTNNYVCENGFVHHNSGKSHKVARIVLLRCIAEKHNYLVVRKVAATLKRSVVTLVINVLSKWASNWGIPLSELIEFNKSDLTIVFKHNGSQILFSGLDDEEKLKSIENISSIWVEEATELKKNDLEQLDLRLRGIRDVVEQITVVFNPVHESHWLKEYFFDNPIDGVFRLKTTYLDNKFIGDGYNLVMANKKITNPRYYSIYGLGNWGTSEGLVFDNVKSRLILEEELQGLEHAQGLDFGYTNDPTAFCSVFVDMANKRIFIHDGFYNKAMSNESIAEELKRMNLHRSSTTCDSSEPKSIDRLKSLGVRACGAKKGKDSINAGIDFLKEFEIIVNAHLVDFMKEFGLYSWAKNKNDKETNKPIDDFNHFIDSLRYAVESFHIKKNKIRVY